MEHDTDPDHWVVEPDAAATGWDRARVAALFDNLNGLLLPGGDPWPQVSSPVLRQLLALAGAANDRGDYFPVWGTCAGFETLAVLGAGGCQAAVADGNIPPAACDGPIARGFDAKNLSLPLEWGAAVGDAGGEGGGWWGGASLQGRRPT